jgi:hypothetical protein
LTTQFTTQWAVTGQYRAVSYNCGNTHSIDISATPRYHAGRLLSYAQYGDYRLWPGPNSNTFVASVLRAAPELEIALPPEAIGKDYRIDGALLGRTASLTGFEASLYGLLGIKVGKVEGIEFNLLGLVAGFDAEHPALKIPAFGRIALDRAAPRSAIADPQAQAH